MKHEKTIGCKCYSSGFVDCLLIAYNNVLDIDVFSFDKKLNNKLKHF